ncbi:MAG: Squalene-associated FAD-dependent desaturase [Francisellaceae bacterium]|nr:Squalene-associated FAD-dependent desaturase [Francisellaceae bacterium]
MNNKRVIIIGGGWAGLSCAHYLNQYNIPITLLEASPYAGGRARGIFFNSYRIDNGQHILINAYKNILNIIKDLNLKKEELFLETPFEFYNLSLDKLYHVKLNQWPNPLNFILGVLNSKGFSIINRFRILKTARLILNCTKSSTLDQGLYHYLITIKEPQELITHFWEPLALATLNTPIGLASLKVFSKVLQLSFSSKHSSNLLLPKKDLSEILPNPILKNLNNNPDNEIYFNKRITKLAHESKNGISVHTPTQTFKASAVVLATPPLVSAQLIESYSINHPAINALRSLNSQPIITIYFEYEFPVSLPKPMIGFTKSSIQWILDKAFSGNPNLLAAIISGIGTHSFVSKEILIKNALQDISRHFPKLSNPIRVKVINQKMATFECHYNIENLRPPSQITENIYLSGDYNFPLWPATLESAVSSGLATAQQLRTYLENQT